MRRKRKYPVLRKTTYAVVVEGETEVWYFQMLKRNEPGLQVNIEPKIPQKKKLQEQYDKVIELAEDYTKVFWIVDLDVIVEETRKATPERKTPIQQFKEYYDNLKRNHDNVLIIVNNPCLEFWFVLHFEQTTRYFNNCSQAENQLKKNLKDYEKTRRYFTKQGDDIYLKLKSKLKNAISNAKRTGKLDFSHSDKGLSDMDMFFETEKIKDSLE